MRLMNTEKNPKQPNYTEDIKGQMEPQLNRDARRAYSKYLCDLVDQCVRFRTYHRIKLPDLWDRIQRYTGDTDAKYNPDDDGDDEERFEKLQEAMYEQKHGVGDNAYRLMYPEEKYKIGMAASKHAKQGDEEQGDGNQGNEDLKDGSEHGVLTGIKLGSDLNEMFSDDEDLVGHGGRRGLYPGDREIRHIDDNYGDEEEDDDPD